MTCSRLTSCAAVLALLAALSPQALSQQGANPRWNFHAQVTALPQGDFGFRALYSGPNSLNDRGEMQATFTGDLYAGVGLWHGAALYADVLLWQGYGLSHTEGIEDFPNGDAFKDGTSTPHFMFAHLFLRQTIGFGGGSELLPDSPLSLPTREDISRLTLTIGRFSPIDMFDQNLYAQDSHSQFLNWAMQTNLAWDFPSDSVGFTTGIAAELNQPVWTLRAGYFQLPGSKNGFTADDRLLMIPAAGSSGKFFQSWGTAVEIERRYQLGALPGAVRVLGWADEANLLNYRQATLLLRAHGNHADLTAARAYRYKHGFGLNFEQRLTTTLGVFSRLGWNDGQSEGWMYTDAHWTASLGTRLIGSRWHRPGDSAGFAFVASGASRSAQAFLQAGGTDILSGDGALSYGSEKLTELYYSFPVSPSLTATPDFEYARNPAFNHARGPVPIFALRLHWQH